MTEPKLTIEEFTPADAEEVLAINAANQPEVGPMDEEKLHLLVAESDAFEEEAHLHRHVGRLAEESSATTAVGICRYLAEERQDSGI